MNRNSIKKMALVMSVALTLPTASYMDSSVALAATTTKVVSTQAKTLAPKLNVTTKTINGLNKSFTLNVSNLVTGSTCKWSSSDVEVATVTSKGKVTSITAGKATIKVKVTAPDKTVTTLSCVVTVQVIPSTSVVIKNAPKDNTIQVGDKFDYNRSITPSNSTDYTIWSIKDTSIATVDTNGIVTGLTAGTTILTAKTSSGQIDSVPVIIKEKSAGVTSVVLNNANEIVIKFSEAIDATTVIDSSNNTLKNIIFKRMIDKNSNNANDYGTLTASLSTDNKVLTIQSSSIFKGDYEVIVPISVKTTSGKEMSYDKVLTITDTLKPTFVSLGIDNTGVIATLQFSEPINVANFVPSNASRVDGIALNATSLNVLTNKNNYVLSQDKKTLKIDLSNLAAEDQGKQFSVILAGITDLTGNPADNITFSMRTDVSVREQAKIVSAVRTGYYTMTVYFNSPIKNPGILQVSGSANKLSGVRDASDYTKVTYTLTNTEASLTGTQNILLSDYSGYNTVGTGIDSKNVNFTVSAEAPVVTSSKIVSTTTNGVELNSLVLTYNKNVSIANAAGTLSATLRTDNDDITSPTIVYTNAVVNGNQVTLTLDNSYIGAAGTYSITLPDAFVKDDFFTNSKSTAISVTKGVGGSSQLPAPTIMQSPTNPNEITLTFSRKIDVSSAENVANYVIPGATVTSASVTYNTTNGATVKLTIANGTIVASTVYVVTISGVKGANGSYAAMSPSVQNVPLTENIAPYITSTKIGSDFKSIIITFSENVKGNPNLSVYQNGVLVPLSTSNAITIANNKVTITLSGTLPSVSNVTVIPGSTNSITDYNNNVASVGTLSATY